MFFKKSKKKLENKIEDLIDILEKSNLRELIYILGSKKQIVIRNILARNIKRSRNTVFGITLITAILVYILQKVVSLNIPVIGKYLADIVEIVEKSR